ncbi:hypothetical protein [Paenibacillus arenosi]|uniref:SGNH domain-containing protein n=1 Tax=Paenibacillus arenosi TaxID=2774142 RepID=A0ABR9B1B8_9BACL|nr:hypothetical protein [Paenibacillus arenosi]MBD8500129.1 hypothetical protein [Paenibacillus arenosi]
MKKEKSSHFYKYNKIMEVILFGFSVLLINIFLSEKLYWAAAGVAVVTILLEIFIKNKEYNPLIKKAIQREVKIGSIEENGITNHYFMYSNESKNARNSEIANAIDSSNELYLIGESGKSYLDIPTDRHWKNIKAKLDKGISFKVLLIDPYCSNKLIRNNLNNIESGEIDKKLDIESLKKLKSRYQNLDIRFTDQIYCSLFFTDKYMIYDPYHLGKIADRIENNFIALELRNDNTNYYILKNHFSNCWSMSRSFEEVIN